MSTRLVLDQDSASVDGLARTAIVIYEQHAHNKNIKFATPNYCLPIVNSAQINMFDIKIELEHILGEHSKTYLLKIFDVESELLSKLTNYQTNLSGQYVYNNIKELFHSNVFILDFASESLYYSKHLKKIADCRLMPKEVREVATKLEIITLNTSTYSKNKSNLLTNFWKSILKNDKNLLDFENKIHSIGIKMHGDIVLPFTKLIQHRNDVADVARINTAWMYWNRIEEAPAVAYVPISMSALQDEDIVDEICRYITYVNTAILVIKIKNIQLAEPNSTKQRELLASIMATIAKKKKRDKNLLTVLLEASDHIWAFPIQAFDIVSASSNLFDKETRSSGMKIGGYGGSAIDEETLAKIGFDDWHKEFNKTGVFPCSHGFCHQHIRSMDKDHYTQWQWYADLRKHNVLVLTDWMRMVSKSIQDGTVDLTVNRLRNSPYVLLNELLVKNYE